MTDHDGQRLGTRVSIAWTAIPSALGLGFVIASYVYRGTDAWWSDATMTIGFTLFLLAPVYWLTHRIQVTTTAQIGGVRKEISDEVEELSAEVRTLQHSIEESQQFVQGQLVARDQDLLRRARSLLDEPSFDAMHDVLSEALAESLVSDFGVRGDLPTTDYYLRIQADGDHLMVHLDDDSGASVFSTPWNAGSSLDDVMLKLAQKVRATRSWPGAPGWEFATAIREIVELLEVAINLRERGRGITDAIQLVGRDWILSSWDAQAVPHFYQITYNRLNEVNWYKHMSGKTWVDQDTLGRMLDLAEFLRDAVRHE